MSEETELEMNADTALSMAELDTQLSRTEQANALSYFHGFLSCTDTNLLLKKKGDFLLRHYEEENGMVATIISFRLSRKLVDHVWIYKHVYSGYVLFDEHVEPTIAALVEWHRSTGTTLIRDEPNLIIKRPIDRPNWLLDRQSLTLGRKVGRGLFGEIFLAEYEGKNGKQKVIMEWLSRQTESFEFMNLARWMRKNNRKNEIKIVGISIQRKPLWLVLEMDPNDSIKEHFLKMRVLSRYLEESRKCDRITLYKHTTRRAVHFVLQQLRPDLFRE